MRNSVISCIPTEHDEQVSLVQWLGVQHPKVLFFAIPNGGNRNVITARKLKAEGVKPGVPDLFFPEPRRGYSGLFVEMKRRRGGNLSNDQKFWRAKLQERGYRVEVCAGFDAAQAAITEYLR